MIQRSSHSSTPSYARRATPARRRPCCRHLTWLRSSSTRIFRTSHQCFLFYIVLRWIETSPTDFWRLTPLSEDLVRALRPSVRAHLDDTTAPVFSIFAVGARFVEDTRIPSNTTIDSAPPRAREHARGFVYYSTASPNLAANFSAPTLFDIQTSLNCVLWVSGASHPFISWQRVGFASTLAHSAPSPAS